MGIFQPIIMGSLALFTTQVTEDGNVVGKYTLIMDGIHVVEAKSGVLDSALHHPLLGVVKPYVTIERSAIEALVKDERFKTEMFSAIARYLPDVTIKFLR